MSQPNEADFGLNLGTGVKRFDLGCSVHDDQLVNFGQDLDEQ
jgi:hypothetical protein